MANRRITITVDGGVNDSEALDAVMYSVGGGRISGDDENRSYCYATVIRSGDDRVAVYAWRTMAGNDSFRVTRTPVTA